MDLPITPPIIFLAVVVVVGLSATPMALEKDKGYGVYTARLHNLIGNAFYLPYITFFLANLYSLGAQNGMLQEDTARSIQFTVSEKGAFAVVLCLVGILWKLVVFLLLKARMIKTASGHVIPMAPVTPHWNPEMIESRMTENLSQYDPEGQSIIDKADTDWKALMDEFRKDTDGNVSGSRFGFDLSGHHTANNTNILSSLFLIFVCCILSVVINKVLLADEVGTYMIGELTISVGSIGLWLVIKLFRKPLNRLSNAIDFNPASGIGYEVSLEVPKFGENDIVCESRVIPSPRFGAISTSNFRYLGTKRKQ